MSIDISINSVECSTDKSCWMSIRNKNGSTRVKQKINTESKCEMQIEENISTE